jgi:hypothetical protein
MDRHDAVAEFLCENKATLVLSNHDAGILMCQAAFSNDVVQVKRLIRNKVSPSASDYDGRSGLVKSLLLSYLLDTSIMAVQSSLSSLSESDSYILSISPVQRGTLILCNFF